VTRINCVDVRLLSGKHLVAEYRELPRIFGLVLKAQKRGLTAEHYRQPVTEYVLGPGHCRFFYTRLNFLGGRYTRLVMEMRSRGYTVSHPHLPLWVSEIRTEWFGDWTPTQEAIALNTQRINERGGLRPAT